MGWRTSLWWSEVFAWSWRAWASTTRLLDAQRAALVDLALQCFLGSICLFCRHHLHEAKATALAGVWVAHDVALLDLSVLLKQAGDLLFSEAWVDAGDEEVGSWVDCILADGAAAVLLDRSLVAVS